MTESHIPVGPMAVALARLTNIEQLLTDIKQQQTEYFSDMRRECRAIALAPVDITAEEIEETESSTEREETKEESSFDQLDQLLKECIEERKQDALIEKKGYEFQPVRTSEETFISRIQMMHLLKGHTVNLTKIHFSTRVYNSLMRAGIKTLNDLMNRKEYELGRIYGMGRQSLHEIWLVQYEITKARKRYKEWLEENKEVEK